MAREFGGPSLIEAEDKSHEGIPAICPYCYEEVRGRQANGKKKRDVAHGMRPRRGLHEARRGGGAAASRCCRKGPLANRALSPLASLSPRNERSRSAWFLQGSTVLSDVEVRGYALSPLKTWSFECSSCGHHSCEVELPNVARSEDASGVRIERTFKASIRAEESEGKGAPAASEGAVEGAAVEGAAVEEGAAEEGASRSAAGASSRPSTLDLMMVRCETASLSIPELEFEIPPGATPDAPLLRGDVASVRDVLGITVDNLNLNQADRAPETAAIIEETIDALRECRDGRRDFTIVIEDPSGLSFIEEAQEEEQKSKGSKDADVA